MSDQAYIDDILRRVEQMLDALELSNQSSTDFRIGCDQLDSYLSDHSALLNAGITLSIQQKSRLKTVINRLTRLQKRAETRANIPSSLQKYIAEQSD